MATWLRTRKMANPLLSAFTTRKIPTNSFRNSSTSRPARTKEYLIQVPDVPNTLTQRHAAQKAHIEGAMPRINSNQLSFFGVTLSTHDEESRNAITGSLMVMKAGSVESVRQFLREDAYTKAGVWDVGNATVTPFRSG